MPEGDSAWRAAAGIRKHLSGRCLDRVEFRVPELADSWLFGVRLETARSVGKHVLLSLGDDSGAPAWVVRFHLGMDGTIAYQGLRERFKRPEHMLRLRMVSASWQMLGFELRSLTLVRADAAPALTAHLGPYPLDDSWDQAEAARRLAADSRPAHVALLDQRNVAGAGNIYGNEVLFLAGVSPLTPFTAETAERAAMLLAKTMRLNLAKPMRSFTGVYRRGENYWVYTRPGKFCRRCGGVIEMTYLGARPEQKRMVFWCPNCQI